MKSLCLGEVFFEKLHLAKEGFFVFLSGEQPPLELILFLDKILFLVLQLFNFFFVFPKEHSVAVQAVFEARGHWGVCVRDRVPSER